MGLRTGLQQSRWLTFAVLLVGLWVLLSALRTATAMDWSQLGGGEYIGYAPGSGVVGLVVLLVGLGLLLVLYSELTETDPAPETWPPE